MTARLEKIEQNEAYFEFEIAADVFETGLERAYRKIVKEINIPGFRKGSAPRAVVEANFGLDKLLPDAMDFVVPDAYYSALKELNLKTIGEPDIEVGYVVKGEPVTVKVIIPLQPEVTLGDLENMQVGMPAPKEVTDNDVERQIQQLCNLKKEVQDKGYEPAALGDTVTIDYKGLVEGTVFEGEKDFKVQLGSETFIPGFDQKLVGVRAGDKVKLEIEFPEENISPALAGKVGLFDVKVKKVENIKQIIPDDAWAQQVTNMNTLDDLRIKLKNDLKVQRNENMIRQAVIDTALQLSEISIPEYLIMQRAGATLEQLNQQLAAEGGDLDMYLQLMNMDMTTLKKQIWQDSTKAVKIDCLLDKMIQEKDFTISKEELDLGVNNFAASIGMDTINARKNLGPMVEQIHYDLKKEKAVRYLIDNAEISIIAADE